MRTWEFKSQMLESRVCSRKLGDKQSEQSEKSKIIDRRKFSHNEDRRSI